MADEPLAFIPDHGKAERIERVLEFTQALARDPRGAQFIGQQVAEILASGKSVYVKVVIPADQEGDKVDADRSRTSRNSRDG